MKKKFGFHPTIFTLGRASKFPLLSLNQMVLFAATVVLIACVAACTNGPTLVGKWKSDSLSQSEDKANFDLIYTMTLNEDSTYQTLMEADMKMEEKESAMRIPFTIAYNGKWSDLGDRFVQVPDTQTVKVEFLKDSLKIEFKDPEMAALGEKLKTTMLKTIEEEFPLKMKAAFVKADTMAYELQGDVLNCTSDGKKVVFNRVKADK